MTLLPFFPVQALLAASQNLDGKLLEWVRIPLHISIMRTQGVLQFLRCRRSWQPA